MLLHNVTSVLPTLYLWTCLHSWSWPTQQSEGIHLWGEEHPLRQIWMTGKQKWPPIYAFTLCKECIKTMIQ